jgi:hypothetical protein
MVHMSSGGYIPIGQTLLPSGQVTRPTASQSLRSDTGRGEFEPFPLAVGTVRGVRGFRLTDDGVLAGISYPQFWTPGENRAACYSGLRYRRKAAESLSQTYIVSPNGFAPHPVFDPDRAPIHGRADVYAACSCGFYAYFDRDILSYNDGVTGLVEGYGQTVIGTSGFRACRARIIALAMPPSGREGFNCPCPLCARMSASYDRETTRQALKRYRVPVFDSWPALLAAGFVPDEPPVSNAEATPSVEPPPIPNAEASGRPPVPKPGPPTYPLVAAPTSRGWAPRRDWAPPPARVPLSRPRSYKGTNPA